VKIPKKHYVPDLTSLASVCEGNYMRLLKLLPDLKSGAGREFNISGGPHLDTRICFSIIENFKYTLTIKVEQLSCLNEFLNPPHMEVRLYEDVRMAEVIRYDNSHRFNGVYHYPNNQMRMPDEKQQINLFLAEWLEHCLLHGEADISLDFRPSFPQDS